MSLEPYLKGWLYIPLDWVTQRELDQIISSLTITPRPLSDDPVNPIQNFSLDVEGYIGVPRNWGMQRFPHIKFSDLTIKTSAKFETVKSPTPRDEAQEKFINDILTRIRNTEEYSTLAVAPTGCHVQGTEVVMYDGSFKKIEDVKVGDLLLGPDGESRKVLQLCRGKAQMYLIEPRSSKIGFDPFIVNEDHLLFIKDNETSNNVPVNSKKHIKRLPSPYYTLKVKDFALMSSYAKKRVKLVKREIDFPSDKGRVEDPEITPKQLVKALLLKPSTIKANDDLYQALIDEGCEDITLGAKYIPDKCLFASRDYRKDLLKNILSAFMISGMSKTRKKVIYQCSDKSIIDATRFLCNSLGINHAEIFLDNYPTDKIDTYALSGRDTYAEIAHSLGIKVTTQAMQEYYGEYTYPFKASKYLDKPIEYYGFTLDRDHLYVTKDFIIHHNSGKTVVALAVASKLKMKTLVICPLDNLISQWRERAKEFLGLTDDEIGIIQQDKCEDDKMFVIASMHSIAMREYPLEVYEKFPLVFYDEIHCSGAPVLRNCIGRFNARHQVALTASPERPDGAHLIYQQFFGEPSVISEAEALPATVIPLLWAQTMPEWAKSINQKILCVSQDKERNKAIAKIIYKAYHKGRNILIIGHKIKQLQAVEQYLINLGVPVEDIGLFTRTKYTKKGKVTQKKELLDEILNSSKIILATFGMMSMGVDVKRLDFGMDVTPKASFADQVIGRIRRPMEGKKRPVWITIVDMGVHEFVGMAKRRLSVYKATGCEVFSGKLLGEILQ